MRIAFATTDLAHVNAAPLDAPMLVLHDVSAEGVHLLEVAHLDPASPEDHLKVLSHCQFVIAGDANDLSTAALRRIGCDVLLSLAGRPIAEGLDGLLDRLRRQTSPWLRQREIDARRRALDTDQKV